MAGLGEGEMASSEMAALVREAALKPRSYWRSPI